MRKKRITQRSIFDSQYADHPIGQELANISTWLDEHPELLGFVEADISPCTS